MMELAPPGGGPVQIDRGGWVSYIYIYIYIVSINMGRGGGHWRDPLFFFFK